MLNPAKRHGNALSATVTLLLGFPPTLTDGIWLWDVREVAAGYDCGVVLRDYADIKEGDVLETYATRQVERELA